MTIVLRKPYVTTLRAFVLAATDEWIVLHTLIEGFSLDEVVILRRDRLRKVQWLPNSEFVARAVTALGTPVENFACAADASMADLLSVAMERDRLVLLCQHIGEGFHQVEAGLIRYLGRDGLELHAIDEHGAWAPGSGARSYERIVRVGFGGRYLEALERFGDDRPAPGAPQPGVRAKTR